MGKTELLGSAVEDYESRHGKGHGMLYFKEVTFIRLVNDVSWRMI